MAKVMTISGAQFPATATTAAVPFSGWTWQHVLAVSFGSLALVGGGGMTYYGFSHDSKVWKWGGIALAGAGVVTIGIAVYLAWVAGKAIEAGIAAGVQAQLAGARMPAVDQGATAAAGSIILLGDGRRAMVQDRSRLADGSYQYQISPFDAAGKRTNELEFVESKDVRGVVR